MTGLRAAVEALRHKRVRVRKNGERHDYVRWDDLRAVLDAAPAAPEQAVTRLPQDAAVRTEETDTPTDAAMQAVEGAVPGGNTRTPAEWPGRQPISPPPDQAVSEDVIAGLAPLDAEDLRALQSARPMTLLTLQMVAAAMVQKHVAAAIAAALAAEDGAL